jgi:hypothetical protein
LEAPPSDLLRPIYIEAYLTLAIRAVESLAAPYLFTKSEDFLHDQLAAEMTIPQNAAAEAYHGVIPAVEGWSGSELPPSLY